ncbi:MAG: flagellar biosynthesis anti-sigma factor FlgM [Gammaproteobacteria bacterium]
MAIDPINTKSPAAVSVPAQPKSAAPAGSVAKAPPGGDDRVDISADAERIGSALAAAPAVPEVDEARVAAIKQALADGSYPIDPDKIAQKIREFESLIQSDTA